MAEGFPVLQLTPQLHHQLLHLLDVLLIGLRDLPPDDALHQRADMRISAFGRQILERLLAIKENWKARHRGAGHGSAAGGGLLDGLKERHHLLKPLSTGRCAELICLGAEDFGLRKEVDEVEAEGRSVGAARAAAAAAAAGEEEEEEDMEMSKNSIQNDVTGIQNDALRFGLSGVKSEIMEVHPLQPLMESTKKMHEEMKRTALANVYGSAFPLKMDLDRQIFSRFQRPAGALPSSMLGLEAVMGALDDFGFEDYLNDPRDSDSFTPGDMHHGMEVRLGLSKGPVHPTFL